MSSGTAAFLDTSIQIARLVHGDELKRRIKDRIDPYTLRVTSDVVKQEFKRRLLEEVQWCLNQLNDPKRPKTFQQLLRHVADVLPPQQERKKNICLQICITVMGMKARGDDTERARRHFRTLLRTGMALFELGIGHVVRDSGCACADYPIREEKAYKQYDFGLTECASCKDLCGVGKFLTEQRDLLARFKTHLESLPSAKKVKPDGKLTEMGQFESFLEKYLVEDVDPSSMNPCLTLGDLIIALESRTIPDFYTMNGKESQYFCRWLRQTMIVRKRYHLHDDIVCNADNPTWPSF